MHSHSQYTLHSKASRINQSIKNIVTVVGALLLLNSCATRSLDSAAKSTVASASLQQGNPGLIENARQLTFDGTRSGEGYFSPDGHLMIFQSERDPANPFYQMYVRNFTTGATTRVSPGYGKTTCGWIAPNEQWLIYSSTHLDPKSKQRQIEELEFRKSGQQKRYSWDYDEHYDIFRARLDGAHIKNLTHTLGYDAEGSVSPDGSQIVFASNRAAYQRKLNEEEGNRLKDDPAYFMDIYIMNADGTRVRQITNAEGYDGGPFFSPDGQRIVWRRFSPDGHTAEIYTMRTDGSDVRQITHLKAMSWAPFYHPSGDYIVFTTSVLGFQNFELYIVDALGQRDPVRVTESDGFDGLPVFMPNGQKLTWNKKISATESQIMIADWNDTLARQLLQLPSQKPDPSVMSPELKIDDAKVTLKFLSSAELKGRATGSPQEAVASNAISGYFRKIGLSPIRDEFTQGFPFLKSASLGSGNQLTVLHQKQESLLIDQTWRPLAFSKVGETSASEVVFAGYGIRAPSNNIMAAYDSYDGLDVKDKWVMVFRYTPEEVSAERHQYLHRYARLEFKASVAKELGARGIIFVNGPNSNSKLSLIPFQRVTGADIGIAAISLADDMAEQLMSPMQRDLKSLQGELDKEKPFHGFTLPNIKLSASIDIKMNYGLGQNTLGMLKVPGANYSLIIGAHGDHLGDKDSENSLRTSQDKDPIHYGADDNASGVTALLELAHKLKAESLRPGNKMRQNIIFAVWSGEELGDLGSSNFVREIKKLKLKPSAYINMDMVGRWNKNEKGQLEPLAIQGIGSSDRWKELVESLQLQVPIQLQTDPYLPTDSMSFYLGQIPTINFFTGVHSEYHTPRDTYEKINFDGLIKVAQIVNDLSLKIVADDRPLPYKPVPRISTENRRGYRIYLGTIPDYSKSEVKGVLLSGVVTGGPAEKAGLKKGDIIVEFSSKKIDNIHDYVFSLESLKPNEPVKMIVMRNGQREELTITPLARE